MNDQTQARAAYDALPGIKDWASFWNGWLACMEFFRLQPLKPTMSSTSIKIREGNT